MDLGLVGKRALVCASSRGLGRAIAQSLAEEGAHIWMCARDGASLERAMAEVRAASVAAGRKSRVEGSSCDLSLESDARNLWARCREELGGVDILIHNVGGPAPSSACRTREEEWRAGFEQLFLGAVRLSQWAGADMVERGYGRIIFVTSTSVVEPIENLAVSTAMRAAVSGFGKTLASELAPHGVTVHMVMPGVVHTERIEALRRHRAQQRGTSLEEEMEETRRRIPAARLGRPQELADLVTFLVSERASYLTGLNIAVDGGMRRSW